MAAGGVQGGERFAHLIRKYPQMRDRARGVYTLGKVTKAL